MDSHDLRSLLMQLKPWRKGPFSLFDAFIDTEWRSDWKWQRLAPHISSLQGRTVLDVGCGSGYHCWRMRGAGATRPSLSAALAGQRRLGQAVRPVHVPVRFARPAARPLIEPLDQGIGNSDWTPRRRAA